MLVTAKEAEDGQSEKVWSMYPLYSMTVVNSTLSGGSARRMSWDMLFL